MTGYSVSIFLDSLQRNVISLRTQEAFPIIRVCYQHLLLEGSSLTERHCL